MRNTIKKKQNIIFQQMAVLFGVSSQSVHIYQPQLAVTHQEGLHFSFSLRLTDDPTESSDDIRTHHTCAHRHLFQ